MKDLQALISAMQRNDDGLHRLDMDSWIKMGPEKRQIEMMKTGTNKTVHNYTTLRGRLTRSLW